MSSKRVLLILAEGAEEMEVVIPVDTLRRGGVEVTVAGLTGKGAVKCSRNVVIVPDTSLEEARASSPYDAVILPGGLKGAEALFNSSVVGEILKEHDKAGKIISAICAGPTALQNHGIGLGKQITSYPSVKDKLEGSYKYSEDRVVVDGNLTTSRGPGTAFEFALSLADQLCGGDKSQTLASQMLVKL